MTTLFLSSFAGIEFRDNTLAVSCLKNAISGISLLSSRTFPLKDDDESISEVNRFISQNMVHPANTFVSVPHSWAMMKFVEVPTPKGKGKEALTDMMRFEIERHIPYQIEDVYHDFQLIEEKEDLSRMLITAVRKDKIDYVKQYLNRLSLTPRIITVSSVAVLNFLEFSGVSVGGLQGVMGLTGRSRIISGNNGQCIIFIDRDEAFLSILKNGKYISVKSFPISEGNPADEVFNDLASEITSRSAGVPCGKDGLILSGTDISLHEISGALEEKAGVTVRTIDPSAGYPGNKTGARDYNAASIGACYAGLGAGTLRINLLPHKAEVRAGTTGPAIAKVCVILILLFTGGIFAGEYIKGRKLLSGIEAKIKANEPEIKTIETISGDIKLLEQKRAFLQTKKENDIFMDLLAELTNIMPVESWVTDFDYKEMLDEKSGAIKRELVISGQAASSSQLISLLESSPYFEKVEFVGSVTRIGSKEGFKIKSGVVLPAKPESASAPQVQKEKENVAKEPK